MTTGVNTVEACIDWHNMRIEFSRGVFNAQEILLAVILVSVPAGCGSPSVPLPRYDPEAMARAAMAEYDLNGDGKLDASELENCPALRSALPSIAKNNLPFLTEEDITERLREFQQSKIGLIATRCRVTRDGAPMPGVTVTFVPEKFMADGIKRGSGISDADGNVNVVVAGERGMSLGYYRIEASLVDASGKETLPPRLNTNTKLGHEVAHRTSRTVPKTPTINLDF